MTIFKCWPFPLQQNSKDYICCFLCICSHSASYLLPWRHRSGSHRGHPSSILIIFWSIPLLVLTLLDSAALDNQSLITSCNASFTQPTGHPLLGLSASPVFVSSTSTPFLTLESPSPSLQISPLSALSHPGSWLKIIPMCWGLPNLHFQPGSLTWTLSHTINNMLDSSTRVSNRHFNLICLIHWPCDQN